MAGRDKPSGIRQIADDFVHGISRALQESFTVTVTRPDGILSVDIQAPIWCYYADPFLLPHQDRMWLFVERMDYRRNRGDLCAMPLDERLRAGPPITILPRPHHCSFPMVWQQQDTLYLLPETHAVGAVDLYRCADFPTKWVHAARLLDGVHASDTVLLQHHGLWWLITAIVERAESHQPFLSIFFAEDLLSESWHPHPINQARLYQDQPYSSMRNAGAPIFHDGRWLRPVQRNNRYYGEALAFMQIDCLSTREYRESPFVGTPPFPALNTQLARAHHVHSAAGLVTFDQRRRARSFLGRKNLAD